MPYDEQWVQDQIRELTTEKPALLPTLPKQSPDDGTSPSWTGLLGSALGGGQGSGGYRLRGSERDAAGNRALLNFGINMMLASGPQRYKPDLFSAGAMGLQGAQQSLDQSRAAAAAQAKDDYTQRLETAKLGVEQNRDKVERLKALLPLLQLSQRSQPLPGDTDYSGGKGGGTGGAPGGGYGDQLTGDIEHDEPIIRQRESGGKPDALNYVARADPEARKRGATASGLYGFVDSTWKEGLAMVGGDAAKYPTADSAPESVQREVFRAVYKARGTAPWDSRTWGQNWVKGADGKYTLVKTPTGSESKVAARTGGTDVAGPPGTVPAKTPPPPGTTPPAPGSTAPATPPPAPAAPQEPLPLEQAKVKAKETGVSVPYIGGNGDMAHPDGNVGPPRPGTPQTPAQQPPAQQTPAPPPGSFEAYLKDHAAHLVPDEATRASFAIEPDKAQLANIMAARRQAEAALKDQYARQRRGENVDVEGPRRTLAEIEQKESDLRRAASDKGRDLEKAWREARQKELFDAFTAQTKVTTDEDQKQRDHRRALELKEAEQEGQFVTDARKKFGDSQQGAYDQLDSLQTLRQLSDSIPGNATLSPDLRNFLVRFGFTPEGLNSESARVQAFESALSRTVIELRKGVQMGQLSDRDLSFIQNMGPQAMQNPETRAAIIGHLITAASRKAQYIERVHELYGGGKAAGGMPWSAAVAQARKDVPEFVVPTMPKELMPGYRPPGRDRSMPGPAVDNTQARQDWIAEHVPRGGLVRLPDGTMRPVSLGQ